MSKIKDNVDLKELEKYDFELVKELDLYQKKVNFDKISCFVNVFADKNTTRKISSNLNEKDTINYLINDLIKADLVEKIKED